AGPGFFGHHIVQWNREGMALMNDTLLETSAVFVSPVGSEGGRSPSTLSIGQAVRPGGLAPGQRWSVGRKREVVLRLLRGESAENLSRELGVPSYRLERWRERALSGIDGSLREREGDAGSEELAAAISPGAGRAYGVARVCDGFGVARSSFYAWRQHQERPTPPPSRRGPKPAISDTAVLSAIRADLARSPWVGEGHRKVWARLRVLDGLRVARKRVLRLMRENGLLSPHRHLPRPGEAHDGHITTDAPNLMRGTDATQIPTVLDGKVWLFAVVEHWNAEAVGWHVAKIGDRYAAAQAVGMAAKSVFGGVAAD